MSCLKSLRFWVALVAATVGAQPTEKDPQKSIRVVYQNLQNYFFPVRERGKTIESYRAVHDQLAQLNADVLVISEVDGPPALENLRSELAKRGQHYAFSTLCRGGDEYRAIGMLAKFQLEHFSQVCKT